MHHLFRSEFVTLLSSIFLLRIFNAKHFLHNFVVYEGASHHLAA